METLTPFTESHLESLRLHYGNLRQIDPCQPYYAKLIALLEKLPNDHLVQLAEANIKFVSILAKRRIKH